MADELVTKEEQMQERQRKAAREAAETASDRVLTDAPDGGHYLVDGRAVDADGNEIKKAKKSGEG